MHELPIAMNIVQIAGENLALYPGKRASKLTLEVGLLSAIEFDALDFALTEATKNTPFENTIIEIIKVTPLAECLNCHHTFTPAEFFDSCPNCRDYRFDLIRGKELYIKSIELDDI